MITIPTLYPTSEPAFNNLANVLNYFLLHGHCLKNLAKPWSIRVKENFHEKIFEKLAISRGVVLFLELKKKKSTFGKNVNSGIFLKRKETKMSAPVQFQAMPDLEKSRWLCIGCMI